MILSELSIQRPVLATVMSLIIMLLGALGFSQLPVREYPDIDPPIVSITTLYRGASARVVETEITDILEEQLSTIEGIKSIVSSSREQGSVITVEFELERDVDQAANDVRDRVSRTRGELPLEADDPIVAKIDTNAQPIFWIALSSDRHDGLELSDTADLILKDRLQKLPGVGNVFIGAERRRAMRVWLDPQRMTALSVTTTDVENAIRRANGEIPAGRVEGDGREFAVRTRGQLNTAAEFSAIIINQKADSLVRIADIAEVEIGAEDDRTVARYNGKASIGLGIVKQTKASTIEVAAAVRNAIPQLQAVVDPGMVLDVAYDSSVFIENSIKQVRFTLAGAIFLVVLVVLLFLRSFRATLIPALAIPVSIIGTFAALTFLGFTINILTLLGLVLAIGLVVDDAIVMLENVHRHMEMGKSRFQAALDGSKEIGFAIIATTVALVAVFIPVAFLTGNVGRLFNEFGLTIAIAVTISTFVALTLSPMLCSRFLRRPRGEARDPNTSGSGKLFRSFERAYGRVLTGVVRRPLPVIAVALVLVAVSVWIYRGLPRELVPVEDRGVAFGIVIAPEGATLDYTDRYMQEMEAILMPLEERDGLFTATGLGFSGPGQVTNGFVFLKLKDRSERERSQQEIVQALFPQVFSIPGVLAFVVNPPSLGGQFSSNPVEYVLQADTYEELSTAVKTMMQKGSELGYLINLDSDLRLNKPQLDITIDRERASGLGVSVTEIGRVLETLLGGRVVTQFKRGSKQYDVIVQLKPSSRSTPDVINTAYIRGNSDLTQLANVVEVTETVGPKELNHYNRLRSATISAGLLPGISLGTALGALEEIHRNDLAPGVRSQLAGQSREFRSSSSKLNFMFVLAVVFTFLVLAAQFESFIHPLTILLSVPLAIVGALAALNVFDQSLNIYSQIGMIMLIGLVTKNSILIVEFANQLRGQGVELVEAVITASKIRLRPILMTSLATIFGVLPIALGLGAGGEARMPLGIAVVGGMLISTVLTLILTPVVYRMFSRLVPQKSGGDTNG